jgi:hypothetical protein
LNSLSHLGEGQGEGSRLTKRGEDERLERLLHNQANTLAVGSKPSGHKMRKAQSAKSKASWAGVSSCLVYCLTWDAIRRMG